MKVSIIIPYNIDRGFLSDAVRSAERQEDWVLNEDYEIIVQHGDCSLGTNINAALSKVIGDFIKICAEDDMLAPGCLKTLYPFAVEGGYDFVCADAYTFEGERTILDRSCSIIPATVSELAQGNTIHGGTILYRRDAMPPWNEDYWTAEEYDVTLRMAADGDRFGKVDDVVYWYRSHNDQKTMGYKREGQQIIDRFHFIRDVIMRPHWDDRRPIRR